MGCAASTEKLENYVIAPLRIELADAIEWNKKLLADAAKKEQKQNDQINLLRFKIEVLIQMCGTEVKKSEILEKRIEALKWALLSQGWSEKNMNNMLATINIQKDSLTNDLQTKLELLSSFDISGTLQKMSKLMNTSADEIIISFSDNDGKIAPVLSRSEFISVLKEAVGDHLDDIDIQIITLRFFDGTMVSIPEFLDFFISTAEVRRAKAATATVRACINKLQLDIITDEINENETRQSLFPSLSVYDTLAVDDALKRLLSLWTKVERTLKIAFEQQSPSNRFIDAQVFQDILIDVCGGEEVEDLPDNTNKSKQSFRYKNINHQQSLTVDDIQLVVERFEVRERIDYISFLQYFSERLQLSHSRGSLSVSSTPYRVSSEWAALRADARLLTNSTVFRSQSEPLLESSPTDLAPPQKGAATPPKLAAKVTQSKKLEEKEPPKPLLSINNEKKIPNDEKKGNIEDKPTTSATSTSRFNRRLSTRTPTKRLKSINEIDEKEEKPNADTLTDNNNNLTAISEQNEVDGNNTTTSSVPVVVPTALLVKYMAGPALFQKYLTARAEKCPEKGKFTESSLKSNLKEMVPNIKEIELVEFTENLKFENDLCTVIDVISTLEALKMQQQSSKSVSTAAPNKNAGNASKKKKSDEKETQPEDPVIIESALDSIATAYQNDKKTFKTILTTSASKLENKSFTEVELKDFFIENIANVTSDEMLTFMGLLKPFIKRERVTPANVIKVLDKILSEEDKRIKLLKKPKSSNGGGGGGCCSSKAAAKEAVHDPSKNNRDKKEDKSKKEDKNDVIDDKESKNNLDRSFETVGNDMNESMNESSTAAFSPAAPMETIRNKRAAMLAKDSLQLSSSTSFAFSEENNQSSSDISGIEDYKQQDQSSLQESEEQEIPLQQQEPQKTNPSNNNNTSKFNAPKNIAAFRAPRQSHNDAGERLTDDAMKAEFKEHSRKLINTDSEVDEPFKNLK